MKYSPRFICWLFLAATVVLPAPTSSACLWIHGTTLDGKYETRDGVRPNLKNSLERQPKKDLWLLRDYTYHPEDSVASANDKAVQTLISGDTEKALKMLEEIEARHPGAYYTAANRGTALELAGQDEEALKWILEGIRRNPDSHMETEWVHVRILETKIQMKKQPDWLKTHTIIGGNLNQWDDPDFKIETAQGIKSRAEVQQALLRQLSVRMMFVKPKDPIVAQMLVELAHIESREGLVEPALEYIGLAAVYGADGAVVDRFQTEMKEGLAKWWVHPANYTKWFTRNAGFLIPAAGGILAVIYFYILGVMRRNKQRRIGRVTEARS